ncbi:MAG: RnfABCDGE type electron transport complex subunit B [Candidatus Krumholzibacteriaceae bacterium]|jgi:electron transport complex protein RnfB
MVTAVLALSALALASSLLLAIVARAFVVPSTATVEEIERELPGVDCGGCGLPGCRELARRIAEGKADVDACPVGGERVARMIASLTGKTFAAGKARRVAVILCNGGDGVATRRFHYNGVRDCASAAILFGGDKACRYACMGLGTCAGVCPFDAIHMLPNALPEVDAAACTACGKCVSACPKRVIKLVPVDRRVHILCSSHDDGATVRRVCRVGCIACMKCVREAPGGAITMQDNLAVVDYDVEIPDAVAAVCPVNTIHVMALDGTLEARGGASSAGGRL